jgi:D-glycero-D-manno-heptose 1,7-bisphosphate phosphatase
VRRAAFLDRDGVLAQEIVRDGKAYAPTVLEDFRLVPDAAVQVRRLRAAGLACVVFTNQPEVERGILPLETLEAMHARLLDEVAVDDIFVCPHDSDSGCLCRKPNPGMLHTAAERWGVSLTASFVIGDRWRDIEAGRAAGCYTVLLSRSYSECSTADAAVDTLGEAVDVVLERLKER